MTLKEKIKRMMDEKEAKLKELRDKVKVSEDVAELRGLSEDIDAVIAELENLKQMYAEADEPAGGEGGEGAEGASEGARSGNLAQITEKRGGKPDDKAEAEKRAKAFKASGEMVIKTEGDARAVAVTENARNKRGTVPLNAKLFEAVFLKSTGKLRHIVFARCCTEIERHRSFGRYGKERVNAIAKIIYRIIHSVIKGCAALFNYSADDRSVLCENNALCLRSAHIDGGKISL